MIEEFRWFYKYVILIHVDWTAGHQEALKREIERLRQVYNYQQNVKKTDDDHTAPPSAKSLIQTSPEKISEHPNCSAFNELIMIR